MTDSQDWTTAFYLEDNGKSPVEEFILSRDETTQARMRWAIEQLRMRNISSREPLVKHIQGKIYELRVESRTNIYRILYFLASGRRIVLLHGFQKKTQKTPNYEILVAIRRMNRFIGREGGES